MRRFLINISFLLLMLFGYFIVVYSINNHYIKNHITLSGAYNILVAGSSHSFTSINADILKSTISISQPGEHYLITFAKLKKLVPDLKTDTLIVDFSPFRLSANTDYEFSDPGNSYEMIKRAYPLLSYNKLSCLSLDKFQYLRVILLNMCLFPRKEHQYYLRTFIERTTSNVENADSTIMRHFYNNGADQTISTTSVNYLDSIIYFCNEKNIVPILLVSPLHIKYRMKIPEKFKTAFKQRINQYKYDRIIILNHMDHYFPDSCFYDTDHLNKRGASQFTMEIRNELNLLHSDQIQ